MSRISVNYAYVESINRKVIGKIDCFNNLNEQFNTKLSELESVFKGEYADEYVKTCDDLRQLNKELTMSMNDMMTMFGDFTKEVRDLEMEKEEALRKIMGN